MSSFLVKSQPKEKVSEENPRRYIEFLMESLISHGKIDLDVLDSDEFVELYVNNQQIKIGLEPVDVKFTLSYKIPGVSSRDFHIRIYKDFQKRCLTITLVNPVQFSMFEEA